MERLQKILALAGYGSRRTCEEIIKAGRVRVNGSIALIGMKVDPQKDQIFIDNQTIHIPHSFTYIAIYKPPGVLSVTSSPDRRYKTILDLLDSPGHLFPVGRLDKDSEGLVILTNDGNISNLLTHPRYEHEKEYLVLVSKRPSKEKLLKWQQGIVLDDGTKTKPAHVVVEKFERSGAWLKIILREGRKRQIRESGKILGLPVKRIIRTRIASLELGDLKPGEWRNLNQSEIKKLKQ